MASAEDASDHRDTREMGAVGLANGGLWSTTAVPRKPTSAPANGQTRRFVMAVTGSRGLLWHLFPREQRERRERAMVSVTG
jgi:hypothetical protein